MVNNIPKELRNSAGIYEILNTVNGKRYIGSTKCFYRRFVNHRGYLVRGTHPNKPMVNTVGKYGIEKLTFNVLLCLIRQEGESLVDFYGRMQEDENKLIVEAKSNMKKYGYNLRVIAQSNRGLKVSPDSITRRKGRKMSDVAKIRMGEARTGVKNALAKFTNEQVVEVKVLIAKGYMSTRIAEYFSVVPSTINSIKYGTTWDHVAMPDVVDSAIVQRLTTAVDSLVEKFNNRPRFKPTGDHCRGGKNGNGKLTESDVVDIKIQLHKGVRFVEIAAQYGVNQYAIRGIDSGATWTHIKLPDDVAATPKGKRIKANAKGESCRLSKLKESQVVEIKRLLTTKTKQIAIAKMFGVGRGVIEAIKSGKRWSHV